MGRERIFTSLAWKFPLTSDSIFPLFQPFHISSFRLSFAQLFIRVFHMQSAQFVYQKNFRRVCIISKRYIISARNKHYMNLSSLHQLSLSSSSSLYFCLLFYLALLLIGLPLPCYCSHNHTRDGPGSSYPQKCLVPWNCYPMYKSSQLPDIHKSQHCGSKLSLIPIQLTVYWQLKRCLRSALCIRPSLRYIWDSSNLLC